MVIFRSVACLTALGSWIGFNHIISLHVGSVLLLPGITLIAELIHFAWIDGTVLLPTREADDTQTAKRKWTDPVLVLGHVLLHGNCGNELKLNLLVLRGDALDHGKLPSVRAAIGIVGQYRFPGIRVVHVSIHSNLFEILFRL